MSKIKIIDNTHEARDDHGHWYGSTEIELDDDHIQALQSGDCLAIPVRGEYIAFVSLQTPEQ